MRAKQEEYIIRSTSIIDPLPPVGAVAEGTLREMSRELKPLVVNQPTRGVERFH